MARKTKTTTTPLEQISSDLKLSESKKHELSRAFQDLQSLSSSIFTLTVQWQDLQSDFDAIEASLKNGIQEMESKEKEIARKVQSVEDRIKNLEAREGEFAVRSSKLEARELEDSEREFAVRSGKLEDSEREFAVRSGKLEESEHEFAVRSSKLEDCERRVKSLEKEVARKEQSVEARIKNVEARELEFAFRFSKLEDSEREFAVRSIKMEDCELRVKNLEKEVARKEQSVEARIKNFEARELEFAVRFSKLEDCEAQFKSLENWNHDAMKGKTLQLVLNERIDVLEKSGDVILAVIKMSSDPAKLVLDAMEGFYPLPKTGGKEFELGVVRSSCVLLLEQLLRASPPIRPNVRDDAKRLSREWKGKMGVEELEVLGFLLLVGVYELVPEFDKNEIVKLFGVIAKHRLASKLVRCQSNKFLENLFCNFLVYVFPSLPRYMDPSLVRMDQLGGLGVVVRDKNGKVIAARARKTLGVLKASVVELLAAKEALNLVSSLGFKKIVVEGDCLSAINLLLGKTKPKKDENAIALDAFCLARGFTSCLFTHVKREGNKVADGVSKFATKVDSVEEWKEDLPSWLSISSELDIQGIAENRATMQFDFPGNVNDQQYQCPGTQASMDHDGSSNLSVPCLQDAAAAPGYYNTPTLGSVCGLPPQKSVDIHCFDPEEWIRSLVSWIIKLVLFCMFFLFFVFRCLVGSVLSKLTN